MTSSVVRRILPRRLKHLKPIAFQVIQNIEQTPVQMIIALTLPGHVSPPSPSARFAQYTRPPCDGYMRSRRSWSADYGGREGRGERDSCHLPFASSSSPLS